MEVISYCFPTTLTILSRGILKCRQTLRHRYPSISVNDDYVHVFRYTQLNLNNLLFNILKIVIVPKSHVRVVYRTTNK